MDEELNKPTFKPRFISEFSMGSLDFERYNEWLKYIEHWSAEINSSAVPNLEMCQHLFAGLVNIYDSWRPLIAIPDVTRQLDTAVFEARKLKRLWEQSNETGLQMSKSNIFRLVDLLGGIKTKLLGIKQVIGLGIVVKRNMTTREKIKAGVRGYKNFDNLPEA